MSPTQVLENGISIVSKEGWLMKRCLDKSQILDALKHAANMINELRVADLPPKSYYELYMSCFDQLRYMDSYLCSDEKARGRKLSELYQKVQYAGNILPRLYLLVTVGSVYIKEREAPAKDVLRDLVEMCRGVQHPLRGLFLRNYLSEMTKDKLPDAGSEYEGSGGNVRDSVQFILQNFIEMNKLWVRMQHQNPGRSLAEREAQRMELRLLVGKNLARLSQLDGVDEDMYVAEVLPKVLEQVESCRDVIAQQYLFEVVVQVFPDEYHLRTLDQLLQTLGRLHAGVKVTPLWTALVGRLADYAAAGGKGHANAHVPGLFGTLLARVRELLSQRGELLRVDALQMICAFMGLALDVYPSRYDYCDDVLGLACSTLAAEREGAGEEGEGKKKKTNLRRGAAAAGDAKAAADRMALQLLALPVERYGSATQVLQLQRYAEMVALLAPKDRKKVAIKFLRGALDSRGTVGSAEEVGRLLGAVAPLLVDADDAADAADDAEEKEGEEEEGEEEFREEMELVARMLHLVSCPDVESQFQSLNVVRKVLGQGGARRMRHTLPPLVFKVLEVARALRARTPALVGTGAAAEPSVGSFDEWRRVGVRIFKFVHEVVTALSMTGEKEMALRLFLLAAEEASLGALEKVAYEFMTQVWEIYENGIADSRLQFAALQDIMGVLPRMTVFDPENYEALTTKTAVHSAKLIKKVDQCRAVYMCAHLFWDPPAAELEGEARDAGAGADAEGEFAQLRAARAERIATRRDERRVFECLQKGLKLADACVDTVVGVQLFVELLDQYLYFFERGNALVLAKYVKGLVALIDTNMRNFAGGEAAEEEVAIRAHYKNTLRFIEQKKKDQKSGAKFSEI